MTPREFMDLVASVQYKPGWIFETRMTMYEGVHFGLTHATIDATDSKTPTCVHLSEYVPLETLQHIDMPAAIWWIADQIKRAEMHEMDEFFRIDGKNVKDPHPELKVIEDLNQKLSQVNFEPCQ